MAWQQVLYFFVRLIHTVTVCWSAKLASVQLRTFRKVHWIWIAKLFLTYLVFLRKGLMAKKRRQGHLLLKPDPRSRQRLQMLKAFILCIHNEIRGLVTPTTTPVENKVTTDIKLNNCLYRPTHLSLFWGFSQVLFMLSLSMVRRFLFLRIWFKSI